MASMESGGPRCWQRLASSFVRRALRSRIEAKCCGIIGYVGPADVEPILVDGVRLLQNRGYDSCGLATISGDGTLTCTKFASKGTTSDCIELLAETATSRHGGHHVGLAHTRWATHGGKTDANAHPHCDYLNRISLVHNGTIENYFELKQQLIKKNPAITFTSDTDTEVIANMIGDLLDDAKSFHEAVYSTVGVLRGTWGLAIIHKDHPEEIMCARNGSPLLVSVSEKTVHVASEPTALVHHTRSFIPLADGEMVVLRPGNTEHLDMKRLRQVVASKIDTSPDPFPHWTLKEIYEQPKSLNRAMNYGGRISIDMQVKLGGLDRESALLMSIKHMIIAGCGTSFHAGLYAEKLFERLRVFVTAKTIDASEINEDVFPDEPTAVLLLSQSGETLDTVRACQIAQGSNCKVISVVNSVGSLLATLTNCGVYLNAGREVAVASTKAFSSQVLVLALLAAWFLQHRGLASGKQHATTEKHRALVDSIHRAPVHCGAIVACCREQCRSIAAKIQDARLVFVLGKGFAFPVALEGALKIKEISYIHAEGYTASALKHGPFALLDTGMTTPVILLVPTDEHLSLMLNCAQQVKARGAYVLAIVDSETSSISAICDETLVVPNNGVLTPLNMAFPLQLLAYELAIARGIDPDKPRGLAKTVTVL